MLQPKDHAKATRIRKKIEHGEPISDEQAEWYEDYLRRRAPQGRRSKGEQMSWLKPKTSKANGSDGSKSPSNPPTRATEIADAPTPVAGALASIAAQDDSPPDTVGGGIGGKCPGCGDPVADADKRCGKCGIWVRFNECQKCHASVVPGDFCKSCGVRAPVPPSAPPVVKDAPEATQAKQPTTPGDVTTVVHVDWKEENSEWVADVINGLLELDDCEPLDDDEKKLLTQRAVPVLNRYMKFGGPHGELIQFGVTVGVMTFPRLWIRHIVKPMRAKRVEEERAKALAEAHASRRAVTTPPTPATAPANARGARLPVAMAAHHDDDDEGSPE